MYSFLALVNRLDAVLVEMEAVPGPQAMDAAQRLISENDSWQRKA